jgi:hypothetical protein
MEVREILQTEIWSAETSRKMFKLSRRVLIVLGVSILCFLIWYVVSHNWLTRSEKRAGQVALSQIDALQNLSALSDVEYDARYKQAGENVEAAEKAAWTARDKSVASVLSTYLMFTDVRRSQQKFLVTLSNSKDERFQNHAATEAKSSLDSIAISGFQSEVLHQALR